MTFAIGDCCTAYINYPKQERLDETDLRFGNGDKLPDKPFYRSTPTLGGIKHPLLLSVMALLGLLCNAIHSKPRYYITAAYCKDRTF